MVSYGKGKIPKLFKKFIQNYDDDSDKECLLEDDVSCQKRLHKIYSSCFCLKK